jgi:hypothetical protein
MNCEDQLGIQKLTIARLIKERDEARREAHRQWLMRACDLEHEYGIRSEYNRLESLYIFEFGEKPSCESDDFPPYELPIQTKEKA